MDSVLGIEVHEGAIEVTRIALNQVKGEWHGTVETLLRHLEHTEAAHILVDPPRVGLHPKAARKLAQSVARLGLCGLQPCIACAGYSHSRGRWMAPQKGLHSRSLSTNTTC